MLRHTVATLAYRGGMAVRNAPADFAQFRAAASTRTPGEILAHIGDLLDWALSMARGQEQWQSSKPLAWDQEVARFFASLQAFDQRLASNEPLGARAESLFQGRHRGRADPRRPARHAAPHGGKPGARRKLFCGRDRRRARRPGTNGGPDLNSIDMCHNNRLRFIATQSTRKAIE